MLKIDDVSEENLEDLFKICKHAFKINPKNESDYLLYKKCIEIKRLWLKDMMKLHGTCAKIAYVDGEPRAQIQFCPEEKIPYILNPRKDVVSIICTYSPFPIEQRKGIATAIVKDLFRECQSGLSCMGGLPCRFVVTLPFPVDGKKSLSDFYIKNGFKHGFKEMFLENTAQYVSREIPEYNPFTGDLDKTIILYNPACEWGYFYAYIVEELIQAIDPTHSVEIYNIWNTPEEYKKRSLQRVTTGQAIIKGQVMRGGIFWTDRETFQREVEEALRN